jgi:hypothetical protein
MKKPCTLVFSLPLDGEGIKKPEECMAMSERRRRMSQPLRYNHSNDWP